MNVKLCIQLELTCANRSDDTSINELVCSVDEGGMLTHQE